MQDVVGFVGPSGTGKSHRASLVAHQEGCEALVDDGLLIVGGKILAGESAKRAPSKIEAIRRAIFTDRARADDVRRALLSSGATRVLVLGTSRSMIDRICETLALPSPGRWVEIESLAGPAQIRLAKEMRRAYGRHVIPAPTVEVRKTFSGFVVDPLRYILRKGADREEDLVMERSVVRPTWTWLGRLTVDDTVVSAIAGRAATEVDGVAGVQRVLVETWSEGVRISIELSVVFGSHIPSVLARARERVSEVVEQMTALNVLSATAAAKRVVLPRDRLLTREG